MTFFSRSLFACLLFNIGSHFCQGQGVDHQSNFHSTADYYDQITFRSDPDLGPNVAALNQFFTLMPKGGDLHHHYSGALYAETFLDWVAKDGHWINRKSLQIETSKSPESLTVPELRADDSLYRELIRRWSDRDFSNFYHAEMEPDEQFFQTFGYFVALAARHIPEGLHQLKQRAKQENLQYLETMLSAVQYEYSDPALDSRLYDLQAPQQQAA